MAVAGSGRRCESAAFRSQEPRKEIQPELHDVWTRPPGADGVTQRSRRTAKEMSAQRKQSGRSRPYTTKDRRARGLQRYDPRHVR